MRLNEEQTTDWLDGYEWAAPGKVTITGRDQFGATLVEDLAFLPHMRQRGLTKTLVTMRFGKPVYMLTRSELDP